VCEWNGCFCLGRRSSGQVQRKSEKNIIPGGMNSMGEAKWWEVPE
jgi:hypothetical protein